jgi:hypothetical protein
MFTPYCRGMGWGRTMRKYPGTGPKIYWGVAPGNMGSRTEGAGGLVSVGSATQGDADLARARVHSDVAQGFLDDAVQAERHVLQDGLEAEGRAAGAP